MLKLPFTKNIKSSESAFTLLEVLIVLVIVGASLSLAVYGILKFRQVITVSNTTKEIVLELRKARRYAIDNVVTSDKLPTRGYYIRFDNDDNYYWGECSDVSCSDTLAKSAHYRGVKVSSCGAYSVIKFNYVTGEFVFVSGGDDIQTSTDPSLENCIIEVYIEQSFISTRKTIEVSGVDRTVKIQ